MGVGIALADKPWVRGMDRARWLHVLKIGAHDDSEYTTTVALKFYLQSGEHKPHHKYIACNTLKEANYGWVLAVEKSMRVLVVHPERGHADISAWLWSYRTELARAQAGRG